MDAMDKENSPAPVALLNDPPPSAESKKNLFSDADMADVDADIERLDAENAAMEAKLQLNRRISFQTAVGETEMPVKSIISVMPSTPEAAAPSPLTDTNPLVDLVQLEQMSMVETEFHAPASHMYQ